MGLYLFIYFPGMPPNKDVHGRLTHSCFVQGHMPTKRVHAIHAEAPLKYVKIGPLKK